MSKFQSIGSLLNKCLLILVLIYSFSGKTLKAEQVSVSVGAPLPKAEPTPVSVPQVLTPAEPTKPAIPAAASPIQQTPIANAVAATTAKTTEEMSVSDALLTFKKESKRFSGFRKKDRVEQTKSSNELVPMVEKKASESKNKQTKRIKSELDAIKIENRRLEDEIMKMIDESGPQETEFTEQGLPDITPTFPGYARLISKTGYFHAQLNFEAASWIYDDKNKIVDLSKAVVGYEPVTIQNILLISRLARMSSEKNSSGAWVAKGADSKYLVGDVALSNVSSDLEFKTFNTNANLQQNLDAVQNLKVQNHYLNRVADKQIEFKADTTALSMLLNFSHTLSRNYAIGLEVPIVFRSNKIEMISEFTTAELDEIASSDVSKENQNGLFFTRYPSGLKDFYRDILEKKGLTPRQRHNQLGIGDISLFVNKKIHAPEIVTTGIVGLGLTFPSGTKTDNSYLWPSTLGNGGFWEVRGHGGLFWRSSGFFNPHAFAEVRLRLGSTVERRISRIIDRKKTRTRDSDGLKAGDLPLGSGFVFNVEAADWKEAESRVPALASGPLRLVDLNRGLAAKLRVGNLFKGIGFANAYLDVYYQAELEQEDSIGFRQINPDYDVEKLTRNTERHRHTFGAIYCYKVDDNWSLELGVSHVFTGKNADRTLQISGGALYNF